MDSTMFTRALRAAGRPRLAALLRAHLEDAAGVLDEVHVLDGTALTEVWQSSTGGRYDFAVRGIDLLGRGDAEDLLQPVPLDDACFAWVRRAAGGMAELRASMCLAVGDMPPPVRTPGYAGAVRVLRAEGALDAGPSRAGLYLAARLLAAHRGEARVRPVHLIDAGAATLTPEVLAALDAAVVSTTKTLDRAEAIAEELGVSLIARAREAAWYGALVGTPGYRLDSVRARYRIAEQAGPVAAGVYASSLTDRWLAAEGEPHAGRIVRDGDPLPRGIQWVIDRAGSGGWHAVIAEALRACGYRSADADRSLAEIVVEASLPAAPAQVRRPSASAPPASSAQPRTRSEPLRYPELHSALFDHVVCGPEIHAELALTAYLHQRGIGPQRLLLTGVPGVGKTTAARAIAAVTRNVFYMIDATGLTEVGYRGVGIVDHVQSLYKVSGSLDRMARAVVVVDELDKLARPDPSIGDGVQNQKQIGVQRCLLALLGTGTPITFASNSYRDGDLQVSTDRMLIVATGSFSDSRWTAAPTTEDLLAAGIIHEIAERITQRIHLPPLAYPQLLSLLVAGRDSAMATLEASFQEIGYSLEVSRDAYYLAATVVLEQWGGAGFRSGNALLVNAARRRLIHALEEDLPHGSVVRVEADDLDLPRRRLDVSDAEPWRSGGEPPAWR
jgi:DNA polymerase III delta prime subunit